MLVAHVAVLLHVKRFASIYRLCNAKIAYNLIDLHFTAECLLTLRKFAPDSRETASESPFRNA